MDFFLFIIIFWFYSCCPCSVYMGLIERLLSWLEHRREGGCFCYLWGSCFFECCRSRWRVRKGFPGGTKSRVVYSQQREVEEA